MAKHSYKVITCNNREIEIEADEFKIASDRHIVFITKDEQGVVIDESVFNDPIVVISTSMGWKQLNYGW